MRPEAEKRAETARLIEHFDYRIATVMRLASRPRPVITVDSAVKLISRWRLRQQEIVTAQ